MSSYQDEIVLSGKQPLLLLLLGVLGGFAAIRTSTRLIRANVRWWPGNLEVGGVHVHHEVVGMVLVAVTGAAAFVPVTSSWRSPLALLFGIGLGLVLDEWALLLHLRDVYWAQEGRSSIDAIVLAAALTLMVLVGVSPFSLTDLSDADTGGDPQARWAAAALVALNAGLTVVTALKGKYWAALASVPLWPVGVVAAVRLARPDSPWARRRYSPRSGKARRATRRAARWDRARKHLVDLVAGRVGPPPARDDRLREGGSVD